MEIVSVCNTDPFNNISSSKGNFAEYEPDWCSSLELDNFNKSDNDSNNSSDFGELPLDMQFNDGHLMAIVMYSSIMLISAIGNIFVFYSIMRIKRRNGKLGRTNMLLLHLALADLEVTFIMMPLEIVWNATVSWRAGDFLCRFLSFFRVFGLFLSGFVLICISLDRYFAVMKPFAFSEAAARSKKLLTFAWIFSIFCSLPQSVIFHVERHPDFRWYEQCVTFHSFPSPVYERAYIMFGFLLMYALPMISIIYCYSSILCKMYAMARERRCANGVGRTLGKLTERATTKTLKMAFITALAFFICWTPYNIILIWFWLDKSSAVNLDQRVQKILFVFACTNSCINPLIYGWYRVGGRSRQNSETLDNQPSNKGQQVGMKLMESRGDNCVCAQL